MISWNIWAMYFLAKVTQIRVNSGFVEDYFLTQINTHLLLYWVFKDGVWDRPNCSALVRYNEIKCYPVRQRDSFMCFQTFLDNNGALWCTGITYIWLRVSSTSSSLVISLFTGFVDKNKNEGYLQDVTTQIHNWTENPPKSVVAKESPIPIQRLQPRNFCARQNFISPTAQTERL